MGVMPSRNVSCIDPSCARALVALSNANALLVTSEQQYQVDGPQQEVSQNGHVIDSLVFR